MPASAKQLVDTITERFNASPSPVEQTNLISAMQNLDQSNVLVVNSIDELPLAENNTGRIVLVNSESYPYYSDGEQWWPMSEAFPQESTLWAWGCNSNGWLGDGTLCRRSSPVLVLGGFTDWIQASSSAQNAGRIIGLRSNGTLWAWGDNWDGQLGTGNTTYYSSPVLVAGGFTDWCQVSAGYMHSTALKSNGTIWAWGRNNTAQLGDNTTISKSSPIQVGSDTDWVKVNSGSYSNTAIKSNGTLWTWGLNNWGQLGINSTADQSSPVEVCGGFTDWCDISNGLVHSVAIRSNGTLWAWGENIKGALGDNTIICKSSPVLVVGEIVDWCQVSAGRNNTAAVRANGTLWAWGCNVIGKLGDGTTINRSSPVEVAGGFTDWCKVSIGWWTSAGLRTNGSLWTWGYGSYGQLGNNNTAHFSSPIQVAGDNTTWSDVSVGGYATAAIRKAK